MSVAGVKRDFSGSGIESDSDQGPTKKSKTEVSKVDTVVKELSQNGDSFSGLPFIGARWDEGLSVSDAGSSNPGATVFKAPQASQPNQTFSQLDTENFSSVASAVQNAAATDSATNRKASPILESNQSAASLLAMPPPPPKQKRASPTNASNEDLSLGFASRNGASTSDSLPAGYKLEPRAQGKALQESQVGLASQSINGLGLLPGFQSGIHLGHNAPSTSLQSGLQPRQNGASASFQSGIHLGQPRQNGASISQEIDQAALLLGLSRPHNKPNKAQDKPQDKGQLSQLGLGLGPSHSGRQNSEKQSGLGLDPSHSGRQNSESQSMARPSPAFALPPLPGIQKEKLRSDGELSFVKGDFVNANACFELVCSMDPQNPNSYYLAALSCMEELGLALFEQPCAYDFDRFKQKKIKPNDKAVQNLRTALSLSSDSQPKLKLQILLALAMTCSFTDKIEDKKNAIFILKMAKDFAAKYSDSLELALFAANIKFQLAILLFDTCDLEGCLSELESIKAFYHKWKGNQDPKAQENTLDPYNFNLFQAVILRAASCYLKMGKSQKGKEHLISILHFENTISDKRIVASAYFDFALLQGKDEEDVYLPENLVKRSELYSKALALDFADNELRCRLLVNLGIVFCCQGKIEQANDVLQNAVKLNVDTLENRAHLQLGLMIWYFKQENYVKSKEEGEKGIALCNPRYPVFKELCISLETVYVHLRDYLKAYEYQQRAL